MLVPFALGTLYRPRQHVLVRVYQGNDDAFHEGTKCHVRVVSVSFFTDAEGAVGVPARPGHDSPEIGVDGQGTSGGHAPISFATQAAARLNQVRSAGFLPCRCLTIWVLLPLALAIQHAKLWRRCRRSRTQAVNVVCTRLRWELACAPA